MGARRASFAERVEAYQAAHGGRSPILVGTGQAATEPLHLYRIEMPNGNGPYNSGLPDAESVYLRLCLPEAMGGWDCARFAREAGEQMGVTEQEFYETHGDASYACDSVAALHKWFPAPARRYLATLGAKLAEYVVPVGAHYAPTANGEVIFAKPEAHKVAEGPLS